MKYTLITGASSGIGASLAHKFAREGHNLILVARRMELLEKVKSEIQATSKVDVKLFSKDLSDKKTVIDFYNEVKGMGINLLINNAGFGDFTNIFEADKKLDKMDTMIDLNIKALTILSTLYAADYADVEGTQIINVSSVAGYRLVLGATIYCATKFYVSAFTEGLDQELVNNKKKMRAKVLAPAVTESEFSKVAQDTDKEFSYKDHFKKFHTANEMAEFAYQLYKSNKPVGKVNPLNYQFELLDYIIPASKG